MLVVDDEIPCVQLIEEALASSGYVPLPAKSGKEALSILRQSPVDAVVLDLLMPEMDGFEVLRRIKEDPGLRAIPIFVLTAKDLSERELALLVRETQAHFQKAGPWKEELLAEIHRVVYKHKSKGAS